MLICVSLAGKEGLGMEPSIPRKQGHVLPYGKRGAHHSFQSIRNCVSLAPHRNGKSPPKPCWCPTMYHLQGLLLSSKEGLSMSIV